MNRDELLAERFEAHRTRLRAVAYRMLGSVTEADDAVQEGWLRLNRSDVRGVENLGGWLTTVVARVCLDMLRSRAARREDPLDAHEPDPIEDASLPEREALLADSVGLALLVVLDTLAPAERLAFVLQAMGREIRAWHIARRSDKSLGDLARMFNSIVQGWINYYGRFYKSMLYPLLRRINDHLVRWACRKYKRLRRREKRARELLAGASRRHPRLFAHWRIGLRPAGWTMGAV